MNPMMNAPAPTEAPYGNGPGLAAVNDPYRAPRPGTPFAPIGSNLRLAYAAVSVIVSLSLVGGVAVFIAAAIHADRTGEDPGALMMIGALGMVGGVLFMYGQLALGLVWLYRAWSWLPEEQRYTRHWRKWMKPQEVALMMLIPYFQYYWMFIANLGLCDALDRMRVAHPTAEAPPKSLALAACICQLLVPFPVGAVLWLMYMKRVERMTLTMSGALR